MAGSNASTLNYVLVTTEADHGWNEFVITVYDNGGNTLSDTLRMHVGNMFPEVQILSPVDSAVLYRGGDMKLRAEAIDHDGSVKYVILYVNGAQRTFSVYPPYEFDISYLGAGSYDVSVKALDNRDDAVYDTVQLTVADSIYMRENWSLVNSGGAISSLDLDNDTVKVCVDRTTDRFEDIALSTITALQADQKYRISFAVQSDLPGGPVLRLWNNPEKEQLLAILPFPNETDSLSLETAAGEDLDQAYLDFQLGTAGTGCIHIYDLAIDNITSRQDATVTTRIIYPNPATNVIYFDRPTDYTIYNTAGSPVRVGVNSSSADVSTLPAGIYFVKTGSVISKFIKE